MQIEKALINDHLRVLKVSWNFRILTVYNFCSNLHVKFAIFLEGSLLLNSFMVFSVYKHNFMAQ